VREDGCIKVADFGLAKMIQDHTRSLTAAGASLGSPAYYPKGQPEMIALLLKHGAKTDLKNSSGQTALDRATEAKKTEAIQLLQKK